jgi:geranylgeranyl diphosphate synthase type I
MTSGDENVLNQFIQAYLPAVEDELFLRISQAGSGGTGDLQDMLAYHMGWQGEGAGPEARGKRIRPLLVLLCTTAAGGEWKNAIPAAAAVELVHNFSLIHDDIEDNSPIRRGRPTVWKLWGIPQAINTGDAMFTLAYLEILRLQESISAEVVVQAIHLLHETSLQLTQGQYLDLSYELRTDLGLGDYWPMITGKTAALLATCTQLGALVAGIPPARQAHFGDFGLKLGLAFQAKDDYLGIWGQTEMTGKPVEGDLVSGKKSLPVLFALSKQDSFARRWRQGPIDIDEVAMLTGLLEREGARAYTEQIIDHLTQQALQALETAMPIGAAGSALRQLARLLLQRAG